MAAGPQADLGYIEQAPFVMHPAPLVVQVEIIALQAPSVVNVTGSKAQFKGTQVVEAAFQAHVIYDEPSNGILLHSDAVEKPAQVEGLVLH